jgi:hypothetical protein
MLEYEYINNPNSIVRSRTGSLNSNRNSKKISNSEKWERNFTGKINKDNNRDKNEDSSSGKCSIF